MSEPIKPGNHTSEYREAKSGSLWGIISAIAGMVIALGGTISGALGHDSKAGVIAGAVVVAAGATQTTLVKLGYINSRTAVKKAASESSGKAS